MKNLTLQRVRELLDYDPETGIFKRKISTGSRSQAGMVVGSKPTTVGYGAIHIDGKLYYSHRLAWFYVHGKWPRDQIDHVNMDRIDNRISNLREATRAQNRMNESIKKSNTSGYKGVSWSKEKTRWEARIMKDRKSTVIGYFDDPKDAHEAWKKKAAELHGEFARSS